jgi:hypothetical protein
VCLSPDETTPKELIDSLYYVDGMSTAEAMEDLLEGLREARLPLDVADDVTPADLAVYVWLHFPDLLERKHAEQFLLNPPGVRALPDRRPRRRRVHDARRRNAPSAGSCPQRLV